MTLRSIALVTVAGFLTACSQPEDTLERKLAELGHSCKVESSGSQSRKVTSVSIQDSTEDLNRNICAEAGYPATKERLECYREAFAGRVEKGFGLVNSGSETIEIWQNISFRDCSSLRDPREVIACYEAKFYYLGETSIQELRPSTDSSVAASICDKFYDQEDIGWSACLGISLVEADGNYSIIEAAKRPRKQVGGFANTGRDINDNGLDKNGCPKQTRF